eukprot:GHVP01043694.1.p2 GENE.GHVP01043694.1~~GHVP01043694.1.p2  ORF type:complete len:145 (-),score=18.20 GHVP01043694.1:1000-1434(-)
MVSIRRFEPKDLPGIQICNLECLPENYDYSFYISSLIGAMSSCYVADQDNEIVGYIIGELDGYRMKVVSLAVKLPWRNLSIAKNLINLCEISLKNRGATYSLLQVRVSNKAAISLYTRLDYSIEEISKSYYGNGEDANVMGKVL